MAAAKPEPMLTPTATLRVVQLALEGIDARSRVFSYDSDWVRQDITPILLLLTERLCTEDDDDPDEEGDEA